MDASPLGKLPPELRNAIFKGVILVPTAILVDIEHDYPRLRRNHNIGHDDESDSDSEDIEDTSALPAPVDAALALMRTCRQARQECLRTFFHLNQFCLSTRMMHQDAAVEMKAKAKVYRVRGWLQSLGHCAAYLRHVTISLGIWDECWDLGFSPGRLASIIHRFSSVFTSTTIELHVRLQVDWYYTEPPFAMELSLPVTKQDRQKVQKTIEGITGGAMGHERIRIGNCERDVNELLEAPGRLGCLAEDAFTP